MSSTEMVLVAGLRSVLEIKLCVVVSDSDS